MDKWTVTISVEIPVSAKRTTEDIEEMFGEMCSEINGVGGWLVQAKYEGAK